MINNIKPEYQKRFFDYYDDYEDLEKLAEECDELSVCVSNIDPSDILDDDKHRSHVVEEMADVLIMIERNMYRFGISDKELQNYIEFKIKRQLERMERRESRDADKANDDEDDAEVFKHNGKTIVMVRVKARGDDDDGNNPER